ncbi:hypothetical protein QYE76_056403 [Lolium multiflorum]|uniref:Transposase (putative) gypsy type domain-containing protein n=1 Tax=Lolium multiflorum TaxID=4521 RepID=A0AAD8WMT0_LOLMU|nr:hypothetical protein QYE76_056403 [Lolium multiflorum]
MGSEVTQAEIEWLYRSRRIPEEVFCRIPGPELKPVPRPGEYIVFAAHFEHGFGLPASDIFRRFLDFYELQPHHLLGNAIFYLSSFTAFMEGYAGITPSVNNFSFFYYLRKNSLQDKKLPYPKPFVRCGGCILSPRQGSNFYKLAGLESVQTWQKSFFYVRNGGPEDFINLPDYVPGPPSMTNRLHYPMDDRESQRVAQYVDKSQEETNLCAEDLNFCRIAREVPPSYAPNRRFHDDCDADPYVKKTHKMGPTYVKRPGNFSTPPEHPSGSDDEVVILELYCPNSWTTLPPEGEKTKPRPLRPAPAKLPIQAQEEGKRWALRREEAEARDAGCYRGSPEPHQERTRHADGSSCRCYQDFPSSSVKPGTIWYRQMSSLPSERQHKCGVRGPRTFSSPRGGGFIFPSRHRRRRRQQHRRRKGRSRAGGTSGSSYSKEEEEEEGHCLSR